jgi:hypothetical protein
MRTATLLATLQWLETRATDDALELFDALMANELFGRAAKSENKDTVKRYPRVVKDAALVKSVVEVLFEAEELGENIPLGMVWETIEKAVASRAKIRAAVAGRAQITPPPLAGADGAWRTTVLARYNSVRGFVKMLCQSIPFGATTDAQRVLQTMEDLAQLLDSKPTVRVPNGYLDARKVDVQLVPAGWWQKLVFGTDRPEGTVDRNAYVFCVLELFHAGLKRRDIFALNSERFSDPRAKLLSGSAWEAAKEAALGALLLPEEPDAGVELLEGHGWSVPSPVSRGCARLAPIVAANRARPTPYRRSLRGPLQQLDRYQPQTIRHGPAPSTPPPSSARWRKERP